MTINTDQLFCNSFKKHCEKCAILGLCACEDCSNKYGSRHRR